MADPLSVTASIAAVTTVAIQATKALRDTVKRFKDRDKTLQRLQNELEDFNNILQKLEEVMAVQSSMLTLLRGPITRCSQICGEFEKCMEAFHGKSKAGFRDWTKMEFMRGNINDFMDTLSAYKSTISVGLGTITMRASTLSQRALEEYSEMIKDTTYSQNILLQRIDQRLAHLTTEKAKDFEASVDLKDERSVIKQCIRICEDASSYLETLTLQQKPTLEPTIDTRPQFEAQLLTRNALDSHRAGFVEVIARLQQRLQSLASSDGPSHDQERERLQHDLDISKECLEVCSAASKEVSKQKVYSVGEAIADGNSDQVVINTLADLFDVRRAFSKDSSAQLIASVTDETAQQMSRDRYGSRFGALSDHHTAGGSFNHLTKPSSQKETTRDVESKKPNPNEMRKRTVDGS